MKNEQKDIIIFTGQSGINIDSCISRLANDGLQYKFFAIDKIMSQLSGQEFTDILGMPPKIQESLWTDAFQDFLKTSSAKVEKDRYVFLTFHACYFHQRYKAFISPVNLSELMKLKDRIKMVIMFIDDCYDIYRRLTEDDQMYDYVMKLEPFDALLQSITNISNLLIWREVENAFSRKIGQLLNVPPIYCISVKHPSFLVSRLIKRAQSELKILYLSHPISAIRKTGYERTSAFPTELNALIQEVLKYENMILFIPDAIDEYRIKFDSKSDKYIPEFMEGWPLPFEDQWLCGHLSEKLQGVNPLNPRNFPFSKAEENIQSSISSSLKMLISRIVDQVNARDRTLVEQSKDGVLVFRPYWAAFVPTGVEEEMKYNYDLKARYGETERRAYLMSTHEDTGKWRISHLFTLIEASTNIDDRKRKGLELLLQKWLDHSKRVSEFYSKSYNRNLIRKELESVLGDYEFDRRLVGSFKGALAAGKLLQKAELLKKGWEEIFNQIDVDDPLLRYADKEGVLLCEQQRFQEETRGFIQNVIIGKA